MQLLIDVGNTKAKYASLDSKQIQIIPAFKATELLPKCSSIVMSSVASNNCSDEILNQASLTGIPIKRVQVEPEAFGVKCAYSNYSNLGIDRWLAVLAAAEKYPESDIVIVDAGTALTIDVVKDGKQHLGGWIIPGLGLMQQAIVDKAPGVFNNDEPVFEDFGADTPSALFNGCRQTCIASVEKAVELLKLHYGGKDIKLLFTGGDGQQLNDALKNQGSEFHPELVFSGLARFVTE